MGPRLGSRGGDRRFLEADERDWSNYNPRRHKGTWTEHYDVGEGLYEMVEYDERSYILVYPAQAGGVKRVSIPLDRALDIARLLVGGEDLNDARRATREEATCAA
jgi:hypothetical protein